MSLSSKQMKATALCFLRWLQKDSFKSSELVTIHEVPEVHREPYIYTGYRQAYRPWKYYIHSILHVHNESFNIWSHLLGFFLVLIRLVHLANEHDVINSKILWPTVIFGTSALVSMILSSSAHFLHSKSPWHHSMLYMLDYAGISIHGFGIGVASICITGSTRFQEDFITWYLVANVLVSLVVFTMFCLSKTHVTQTDRRRVRLMLFALCLQGLFLFSPLLPRYIDCYKTPECNMASFNHINVVILCDILSALTYAALIPERFIPGCVDIFGHSHQIFHVIVVLNMFLRFRAVEIDIAARNIDVDIFPDMNYFGWLTFALFFFHIVVFFYFLRFVKLPSSKRKLKEKGRN